MLREGEICCRYTAAIGSWFWRRPRRGRMMRVLLYCLDLA